jgi:hypothetical protein
MLDKAFQVGPEDDPEERSQFLMLNCLLLTRVTDVAQDEAAQAEAHAADGSACEGAESANAESENTQPGAAESNLAESKGVSSRNHRFEEEVNAYLENLFKAFSDPASAEHLIPYLFDYDIEALHRFTHSNDARLRYTICRTQNDVLIISVGVFDSAGEKALPCGPDMKHGTQGQMGRGEVYYNFAFAYSSRVPGIKEAILAFQERIATGFEKFATILSYVTGQPFDLSTRLTDGEIYHLLRSVETTAKRTRLERKQNEFLDAYLDWRDHRTEEAQKRVILVADELRRIDPTFSYTPGK